MEKEQNQIERIELYLEDKLEGEELKAFEHQLEEDESFRTLYRETRSLIQGIKQNARHEMFQKLKKLEAEQPVIFLPKQKRLKKLFTLTAIAASIIIVIGLSFWFINQQKSSNLDSYLAETMVPYQNIIHPTQRSEETSISDIKMAYHLYDAGYYSESVESFKSLDLEGEELLNAQFYIANSYMALDEYEQAIEIFTNLLQNNTMFENQSRWFLSLCYLKTDKKEKALEQLSMLKESESSYTAKAEELMSIIEE